MFQDGSFGPISPASSEDFPSVSPTARRGRLGQRGGRSQPQPTSVPTVSRGPNRRWHEGRVRLGADAPVANHLWHWTQTLPFQQFQALLTLFSKFFSSFPHGTCSLSVSCAYLALDGIYHPLSAALPSNTTRRQAAGTLAPARDGAFTLYDRSFERQFRAGPQRLQACRLQPGLPRF